MANNRQLVPYTFQTPQLPLSDPIRSEEPGWNGVYFTVLSENQAWILDKILSWFAGREEIILVDAGACEKQDLSYLLLEWENCEIDPLFLAILRDEEFVEDYSIHFRALEDYQ